VRSLVGEVKHAHGVEQLRDLLATSGGEVIFTTIEKFRLRTDRGEIAHPILSERSNIIVIADEAHRSQYGFLKGFARYLADALPNARRLGFTGTPVSLGSADTVAVSSRRAVSMALTSSKLTRSTPVSGSSAMAIMRCSSVRRSLSSPRR
jgi:type I site-specific restriction-modification system R (restriction) subunit